MLKRMRVARFFDRLSPCGVFMVVFTLVSAPSFADPGDRILRFSSPGIDRYADGSVVADGECYALVWSPKGRDFSGFGADGTASSPDDRVVMAAPLAKDGRCRDTLFHVSAADYSAL